MNGSGPHRPGTPPPGVANQQVTLLDAATGHVDAITTTDANGNYTFDNLGGLELGSFKVQTVLANESADSTYTSSLLTLTRGDTHIARVELGAVAPPVATPPPPQPPQPPQQQPPQQQPPGGQQLPPPPRQGFSPLGGAPAREKNSVLA